MSSVIPVFSWKREVREVSSRMFSSSIWSQRATTLSEYSVLPGLVGDSARGGGMASEGAEGFESGRYEVRGGEG